MEKEKTKPVYEVRFDLIVASIWKNESKNGTRYNVILTRFYKDGENWKRPESFGRDDLLVAAKALDLAHTCIYELSQGSKK